ncbi:phage tail protein [Brevibacillus sp. MER 51]|uniref:phage tail protein n=1 Tax=Brevibacillus sp. MER 51 TaxID=2939560 RepID=UPI00203A4DCA|nr:phage tail protein [Brevibacillus sp. MER 51]
MAEKFYAILTNIGKAKIANATALGTKVNISTLVVGDGLNGGYYNPTEDQTSLKHQVWQGQVNMVRTDEQNPNWIVVEAVIPADVGGFSVREAGILDDQGNLLAVGKYPETYKPVLANGSAKDLYIRMILEVSNAATVTLKIDPATVLVTKKYVDDTVATASQNLDNKISSHIQNGNVHVTPAEKDTWNSKAAGNHTHPNATQTISGFLSGPDKKKLDDQVILNTGGAFTGDVKIDAGLTVRLKVKKSGKDSNGKFTTVEWRRKKDNTLFMRSVLSIPDVNGNYQTDTWSIYNAAGTAVIETVTWTLTYDADGDFVESS